MCTRKATGYAARAKTACRINVTSAGNIRSFGTQIGLHVMHVLALFVGTTRNRLRSVHVGFAEVRLFGHTIGGRFAGFILATFLFRLLVSIVVVVGVGVCYRQIGSRAVCSRWWRWDGGRRVIIAIAVAEFDFLCGRFNDNQIPIKYKYWIVETGEMGFYRIGTYSGLIAQTPSIAIVNRKLGLRELKNTCSSSCV